MDSAIMTCVNWFGRYLKDKICRNLWPVPTLLRHPPRLLDETLRDGGITLIAPESLRSSLLGSEWSSNHRDNVTIP